MALLTACGGASGALGAGQDGGNFGGARLDLLLRGSRPTGLLSFSIDVTELRVIDDAGGSSSNLLAGPTRLEFVGSHPAARWLASRRLDPRTVSAIRVVFDATSARVIDSAGEELDVTVDEARWDAVLTAPYALSASSYARFTLDLDLRPSLRPASGTTRPLHLNPEGIVRTGDGSAPDPVDEIKGLARSSSAAAGQLAIDAYADDDALLRLGPVTVLVDSTTVFAGPNGILFSGPDAFFIAIQPEATFVEVHGTLNANGRLHAYRVEIEDHVGGAGSAQGVEIEGILLNLEIGRFDLLVSEIEKGASIAAPVLASLGSPQILPVAFDIPTRIFQQDGTPVGISTLSVGQEVDVEFPMFLAQPFLASEIEIQRQARITGVIHDTSGLPASLVLHAAASDPALLSGDIASEATDVLVELGGSTFTLNTREPRALAATQLPSGIPVTIQGNLHGSPGAPILAAGHTQVVPGYFRGFVSAIAPAEAAFDAAVLAHDHPFGSNVTSPPFAVRVAPSAVFTGDATDVDGFFDLFRDAAPGQTLIVEVEGVGSGRPDEVLAFQIAVVVE